MLSDQSARSDLIETVLLFQLIHIQARLLPTRGPWHWPAGLWAPRIPQGETINFMSLSLTRDIIVYKSTSSTALPVSRTVER